MAGAPDEYSAVFATVNLAVLEEEAIRLSNTLQADGATAQASQVRQAFLRLLNELKSIAREIAVQAGKFIREEEASSRVRPSTQGGGGPRLQDSLGRSHPLPGVEGSVGVNHEPTLEATVPWWWTNEEGYGGHVGRTHIGFFFDAGFTSRARPDPARFREHPLFRVGSGGGDGAILIGSGGRGKKMTIRNPIPERRFVQRGAARAEVEWHKRVDRAKQRFVSECARAVASAPPPRIPGRPLRRPRP